MLKINARKLLEYTVEELWDMLEGSFTLVFEDGELETNARETLYSSYGWSFHREYPNTPLLKKHHVRGVLGEKRLSSDTHLVLLGNIMWSVHDAYVAIGHYGANLENQVHFRDDLAERIYRITNHMYNDLSYRLEEYVVSLDITEFIEVMNNPRIKTLIDNPEPTKTFIDKTYGEIRAVLFDKNEMPDNMLSLASRSGLIKFDQLLQCVGPRGFLTDTNSVQFPVPVLRGYAHGMRSLYDSMVESRSAAKSLLFSKTPLQQAEYFSRRLQLVSQVVRNLHMGDCGSTNYTLWKVRPRVVELGNVVFSGDLKQLAGTYYMDDDNTLKVIRTDDTHLIGKTLKLRKVIHCQHPDPYGICSTCFGELALSVPANTNIGQICCTSLAQKTSQSVMSVKHYDSSAAVEGIILNQYEKRFLKVASDENSYMLSDELKGKKPVLVIPAEQASNITDVMEVSNVEDLNITRVSEFTNIGFYIGQGDDRELFLLDVNIGRRLASMTYQLLRHIRTHGWGVDDRGNYTIDLSDYDWTQPILTLPLKHFNMSDHGRDIASLLESSVSKMQERDKTASPDATLIELFDLVNSKLSVNIAVLDVVLYASMVTSAENGDYSLPKPWTGHSMGVMKSTMAHRSLSAAMAYENHREVITSPVSFMENNRPDHIFDYILLPDECVKFEDQHDLR